ncbi:CASP8 and FADD-like apoptosis regulator isoform X1 [Carassius auratus]|uniref:CASP8 and FADD-like apoptosis regulator isoform X1 n=1 Tax=Carassius auratus TaxID=7957 RepID=A0A6P6KPH8_CARAU|nr:CASP8 and FADD-like apoptosis regulator isoform X1 [Carassius auratus]XP_026074226.1 CASP8 and FADD-like apoptosis regulator isoform X1 [Carassius auratus]
MSSLYHTIIQITDELSTDECKRISYLCGALDTDKFSTDPRGMLRTLLCQTRMDYLFLMELILKIKRYDLLRAVLSTNKSTVEGLLKNNHSVSEYRVLMADVSEDMDTEDLKSLAFLLRGTLPKHKLENAQSFLDVAVELEKLDQLSSEKMDLIEHCLRSIHRADLAKKISHYQQTVLMTKQGSSPPDRLQFCRMPLPSGSFGVSTASCNLRPISKLCDKPTTLKKELLGSRSYCQQQEDVYSMQSEPRGVCLIIDCVGSEADELEQTFQALNFHVITHKLLSVRDVQSALREVAHQQGHYRASAFICCVISRSRSSDLLATDSHGPGLNLDTVRCLFTSDSCPGLAGKPKLFFIQSYEESEAQRCAGCVGCGDEEGGELETDAPGLLCSKRTVPVDADIFWSHCWTKGRQLEVPNHRSVYLRALRSSLTEGQKRRTHLVDVHMAVNRAVYDHNHKSPESSYFFNLRHTLRKKVYLS